MRSIRRVLRDLCFGCDKWRWRSHPILQQLHSTVGWRSKGMQVWSETQSGTQQKDQRGVVTVKDGADRSVEFRDYVRLTRQSFQSSLSSQMRIWQGKWPDNKLFEASLIFTSFLLGDRLMWERRSEILSIRIPGPIHCELVFALQHLANPDSHREVSRQDLHRFRNLERVTFYSHA
jgi:hypothetical protein